jgi:DHA3 family macrolide efflux protein-like MFS transporter
VDVSVLGTKLVKPQWARNVALFIAGQQATAFGSMMVQIAVLWYLSRVTESGWVLTLGIVFNLAPQAVVSFFSGVLADRMPRKLLIIGSDIVIAVASLGMALALTLGVEGLWFIFLASAIRSAFAGLQSPAFLAVLPQIAPEDQLMRLNGIGETIGSVFGIAAPLVGGFLMATVGLQAVLVVDVVAAIVGISLLLLVPMKSAASISDDGEPTPNFMDTFQGGFTYIRNNRPIKWLLILSFGSGFFATIPLAMTILLVVRTFGGHQWMLSGLEMSFSGGYLIGAASVAVLAAKLKRNRTTMMVFFIAFAGLLTVALGLAPNIWALLASMVALSAALAFWMTPIYTFLQEQVEEESAGRVFGIQGAIDSACAPSAFLIFGPLADRFPVETILVAVGTLSLAWIAAILANPKARQALAAFNEAPPQ